MTPQKPHLSAEQRRALAMLATSGRNGTTQSLLTAHGFGVATIAGLVNQRLATLTREKVKAGGKLIEVARVRITDAGRRAACGAIGSRMKGRRRFNSASACFGPLLRRA